MQILYTAPGPIRIQKSEGIDVVRRWHLSPRLGVPISTVPRRFANLGLGTAAAFAAPMKKQPETILLTDLDQVTGGMKWEGGRESYNVEDRRPGAPPLVVQKVTTWWHNVRNGYWY
jgi:hypothetical protein